MNLNSLKLISLGITFLLFLITLHLSMKNLLSPKREDIHREFEARPPCTHCKREAKKLSASINFTENPCSNFENFVCGNKAISVKNYIETTKNFNETAHDHQAYVLNHLETLLKQPEEPNESSVFKNMKRFYSDCKNLKLLRTTGVQSLLSTFAKAGGFPILDPNWTHSFFSLIFSWESLTYKFQQLGVSYQHLFQLSFKEHPKSTSQQLNVYPPTLRISLQNDTIKEAYIQYLKDLVILLGANETDADEQIRGVVEFQSRISIKRTPRLGSRKSTNLTENEKEYWKDYFTRLASSFIKFDEEFIVNIHDEFYFYMLFRILITTPNPVLANFFFIQAYLDAVDYLGFEFRYRKAQFLEVLTGQDSFYERAVATGKDSFYERELFCTKSVASLFEISLGPFLIQKEPYYKSVVKSTKSEVLELIQNLKWSLLENIQSADWIDSTTKLGALQKVTLMEFEIGYPDELLFDLFVNQYFSNFTLVPKNPYKSFLAVTKFNTMKEFQRAVNQEDVYWTTFNIFDVHIDYSYQKNKIKIPVATLQSNYINPNRPDYINYGIIGTLIGQNMMRAFDPIGRDFDFEGKFRKWWSKGSDENYQHKISCLKNKRGTDSSSFSDISGVKLAYDAYNVYYLEKYVAEERLLSTEMEKYSPEQVFWISMGQVWCVKKKKNDFVSGQYRVLDSIIHSEDFSNDFECGSNDIMNPNAKCPIWENKSKPFNEKLLVLFSICFFIIFILNLFIFI